MTNAGPSLSNGVDNRVITASSATAITGESNVHINGGHLIVGHTASTTTSNGEGPFVQVKSTDSRGGISLIRHSANAAGGGVYIGKSRNATIGSNTVVQSGDELGRITFSGDDGTVINTEAAKIVASVDGTPGSNDMPGRLMFYTTADGAASPTERIRIGSAGQIGIGGANFGTSGQVLTSGGASAAPTWGSAGGITDFDEWYQSNQPAGDQDPIQTWNRSNTNDSRHGVLGGAMSHSSGIWTFPSTGYWFISFTGWTFNQNRKNRYAQFRIQTTSNNSSYSEQASCSCRNEDDNGDGNGATYVSAHCQTIFDCQDTANYKAKFTVDMEDNSTQTMGGRNFTSFTVIKLANT